MDVDIGRVIAGKYELVRLIGKGAMGEVWLAKHTSLGGEFAIKLVEPHDDIEAETAAGRFQLEAQIAAKLSRKTRHIVSVSDHGEEGGLAYLVMELLEGESLEAKLQRAGAFSLPETVAIVSQISRALVLAHGEGVFHRDLKPANVWLARDEDGRLLVKLLDFGIARAQKSFRTRSPFVTSKDMVLGTPSYMSPEQARGLETLDHRCDLWALCVVAYEALTQRIPFEGESVEDIFLSICTFRVVPVTARRSDLGRGVEAFFTRAFAAKVDSRFATASELTEAFEELVTPEELEVALGIPRTPASARRLEAARRSRPELGEGAPIGAVSPASTPMPMPVSTPMPISAPVGPPRPASHPNLAGPDPFGDRPRSSPDLDPVALGGTGLPRSGTSMSIIVLAAALATVLVGVLLVVTFRTSGVVSARRSEGPPVPSSLSASALVSVTGSSSASQAPPSVETGAPTPGPAPASTKGSDHAASRTNVVPAGKAKTAPEPSAAKVAAPTAAAPTAAPNKTPAPAKSVKKEEVF